MSVRYWCVIPAAGTGSRMGVEMPKQYVTFEGKTILEYTIDTWLNYPLIEKVCVALHRQDNYWKNLSVASNKKIITCYGGDVRVHSVLECLSALELHAADNDWVLVHDAVRPCVTQYFIDNLISKVGDHPVGGILGIPCRDTIKRVRDAEVIETVSRENLWRAQTPQMFRYGLLKKALEKCIDENVSVTDESLALERIGLKPLMVEGSPSNIKITFPGDLALAEVFLKRKN